MVGAQATSKTLLYMYNQNGEGIRLRRKRRRESVLSISSGGISSFLPILTNPVESVRSGADGKSSFQILTHQSPPQLMKISLAKGEKRMA